MALPVLFLTAHAENGARYLFICADALRPSIEPLAQWRQATGISTKVVTLSEIGNDTTAIKRYIRDAYTSWPIRPEYVLLVGDGAALPARLYFSGGYLFCSSDNIYADVTGDYEAELAVGRFPASTPAELDVMVAKTLKYEKDPDLTDSLWMRRLTTIIREGGTPDDTIYWDNVRDAARKAHDAGFVNCDSLSYFRGHNSTSVMNSCNAGTGFVLYRGVAGGTWPEPFDRVTPDDITATNKLPIVCSITCQTMSLAPGEEMLGDWWMLSGNLGDLHGGVAFFGNTHPDFQVAPQRGAITRGFFDGLFDDGVWRLGRTAVRAKHQLYVEFPADTYDYRGFSLYGDPALGIWTATPRPPAVQHPASIQPGPQQLTVTVNREGTPVEGALVCCLMDSTVYAWDTTDAAGQARLDIAPTHPGPMAVTVTGRNLRPYEGRVLVLFTGAPYVSYLKHTTTDSPPAGNGDGLAGPGETVTLPVWVINYGDSTAQTVAALLSTADPRATVLDSVMGLGDIPGHDSASTGTQGFRLSIARACPDRHVIGFDLLCRDARGDTWRSGFTVTVCAPVLTLSAETVVDTAGNGNGRLDPSETAQLVVTLDNSGLGPADSTRCVLRSTDPRLIVTDSLADIGTIRADSVVTNAQDPFTVSAADMVPETQILCTLRVSCLAGEYALPFTLTVGAVTALDPIPDGPRLPPLYWAFDDVDAHYPEHPTYDWAELNGVGTPLTLSDNQTVTIDLPAGFGPFRYYGRRYSQVSICSNGWLAPGATTAASWSNVRLPRQSGPPMLAVNWDDLIPGTGSAAWYLHDTAEHRFIVQWDSFRYRYSSSTIDRFQVIIYDTTLAARDGNNEFVYQYATANWIQSSTIGIQDPTPSIGITVIYDATRNRAAAPIYARRAIKFTTDPPIVGISELKSQISNPKSQMLSAFPNPFTDKTTIRLSPLATRLSPLVLRIYDSQGRLVRALTVNRAPYAVWDGRDNSGRALPSGAYFVLLRAGTQHATVRLVLQR